jgi:hypothetical protein
LNEFIILIMFGEELLIMQFPPISRHFIPHRSKYFPQHPFLKHPQSVFLP